MEKQCMLLTVKISKAKNNLIPYKIICTEILNDKEEIRSIIKEIMVLIRDDGMLNLDENINLFEISLQYKNEKLKLILGTNQKIDIIKIYLEKFTILNNLINQNLIDFLEIREKEFLKKQEECK